MTEQRQSKETRRTRRAKLFGRCDRLDVVIAFRAVDQEIRIKHGRLADQAATLSGACDLARRIKDQRDLVRQIMDRRNRRHARRLLRLNRRHRERLLALALETGLDTSVLIFK